MERHHQAICEFFAPKQSIADNVDRTVERVRKHSDLVVGLHIRHGDYAKHLNGLFFYSIADYRRFMIRIAECYADRRVRFLVCSDATLQQSDFHGLDVVISKASPLVDLYSLAGCDLLAGPPSSFTEWASYYGNVPLCHIRDTHASPSADDFRLGIDHVERPSGRAVSPIRSAA